MHDTAHYPYIIIGILWFNTYIKKEYSFYDIMIHDQWPNTGYTNDK